MLDLSPSLSPSQQNRDGTYEACKAQCLVRRKHLAVGLDLLTATSAVAMTKTQKGRGATMTQSWNDCEQGLIKGWYSPTKLLLQL